MLNGVIYITSNLDNVRMALNDPKKKVIFLSEDVDEYMNILKGTILLPPYQAVMCESDGDFNGFVNEYVNFLRTESPDKFICTMIMASIYGFDLILYVPADERKLMFSEILMGYLLSNFGIVVEDGIERLFYYDRSFDWVISCKLYLNDIINVNQFFDLYPNGIYLSEMVLPKLLTEGITPDCMDLTTADYMTYFNSVMNATKKNKKLMYNPISFIKRGE